MKIGGIGQVSTCGRGVDLLDQALKAGWQEPSKGIKDQTSCAYLVNPATLKDKSKKTRRADKFSKMAVIAAQDAIEDCGITIDKSRVGLIVSLAFGPHATTFEFLDTLLDYGDSGASPIKFSNSVQNSAASYITEVLGITGPCLTVTQFQFSFQNALLMGKLWIEENRCDYCLVGAVDQYGEVMGFLQNRKLTPALDGKIKPFSFHPTCQVPGEGAAFFMLGKDFINNYCQLESITFNNQEKPSGDLNIIDTDGTLDDESAYLKLLSLEIPTAAYSPLFGSMLIGSAFNTMVGALSLKNQQVYENPVTENPLGLNIKTKNISDLQKISCISCNCKGQNTVIEMKKHEG